MFNHDSKTSDIACEAVKKLFGADKVGDVTLEVIRLIGRAIKVRKFDVKPKVLDTFLSLKIKEVSRDSDDDGEVRKKMMTMEEKRKMSKMMSKRDRKRKKQMKELEKELEEAAVTDNTKRKIKMHTEIVSMVFLTYFRILKLASDSKLLSSVLAGLAKFAHLINVSYFDDLFAVLTKLVESGDLTTRESLHCIETSLTLLLGQGSAFNIDPYKFYLHLYKTLLSFNYSNANTDLPSCIKCLDLMFNKRKRHVSDQRCLAYVKRLSILSTHLSGRSAITVLSMIREIIRNYPKCEVLLDTDSIGNGKYDPESDNPDFCNAQNTSLFELHLLRSSYEPDVRTYAQHILQNCPSDGRFRLPLHLINIKSDYVEKDSLQCIGRISELKRKN
ncbi:hypothetical protein HELRODRAFT_94691 [Helobdella robusta]|uniref:CCAAT-binding factor domain-containing protein n=1 Tax=Helobdella robusta TaxID=6412 RepID=T1G924_HELRO|nr:hypothetical protein HELRODRAFT_94691 [Helobdella robusta]ESO02617.1 hypothetical protein HELRODRAFT_94691 [Helobdella robusta]